MTKYMLRRLARAAAMRVRAKGWVEVAKAVNSRPEVCRRWPDRYPGAWRALTEEARRMAWEETNAEALWVLTRMAASGDAKAAKLLTQYGDRLQQA